MKISSIEQYGDRVAVRQKFFLNPSLPAPPGKEVPEGAFAEQVVAYDSQKPIVVITETTGLGKSGKTLDYYNWGDFRYLNLSALGATIATGSINSVARTLVCDEELRTPLVSKIQLADMKFSSLSSTTQGDGDVFYTPIIRGGMNTQDQKEAIVAIRYYEDRTPNITVPASVPELQKYRIEVSRIKFQCMESKILPGAKRESYDASHNLVALSLNDPSWTEFADPSPLALLHRILCPVIEFGGVGIEATIEDNLIKVVRVIDGTPAARTAVKADDIITHINDESADGLTLDQAIQKMRGPANTEIKLRIRRKGQDSPIELSLTREIIKLKSGEAQK